VALLDYASVSGTTSKLSARISWAVRIAEASVPGGRRFLPAERNRQPVRAILTIGWAVFAEALIRLVRALFERRAHNAVNSAEKGPP
jgi:hypothetical protein